MNMNESEKREVQSRLRAIRREIQPLVDLVRAIDHAAISIAADDPHALLEIREAQSILTLAAQSLLSPNPEAARLCDELARMIESL